MDFYSLKYYIKSNSIRWRKWKYYIIYNRNTYQRNVFIYII